MLLGWWGVGGIRARFKVFVRVHGEEGEQEIERQQPKSGHARAVRTNHLFVPTVKRVLGEVGVRARLECDRNRILECGAEMRFGINLDGRR